MLRKIFLPGLLLALLAGVLLVPAEAVAPGRSKDTAPTIGLNSANSFAYDNSNATFYNYYRLEVPYSGILNVSLIEYHTLKNFTSNVETRLYEYGNDKFASSYLADSYEHWSVATSGTKKSLFTVQLSPGSYYIRMTGCVDSTFTVITSFSCQHSKYTHTEKTVPATCTAEGAVQEVCTNCKEVVGTLSTIPMLPHEYHDEDWSVLIPATCTATGVDSRRCRNCTATQERESALRPHPYGEWVTDVEPTCTAGGSHTHVCTVCGHEETQAMSPLPHPYDDWVVLTEPTCTTGGQRMRVCPACNKTDTNLMPALGHEYGAWSVTAYPSCTAPGASSRTCGVCGYVQEQAIDQLDHVYDSWQTIAAPTAGEAGQESGHCAICGGDYVQAIPLRADYMAPMGSAHKLWWTCTAEGTLSLTGQAPAGHAVLAGVYDGDALAAVRLLTPGQAVRLDAPPRSIRLFWLDDVQAPQCPRVDVEKYPAP